MPSPETPKRGRPTKYKPEFARVAKKLCERGATDGELAEVLGVTTVTVWRWQVEHEDFCNALKAGKEIADDRVERSLYQRAVGYTYNSEKLFSWQGNVTRAPCIEHVPPDPSAAMNWLTNRRPDKWRSKQSLEHTGANGEPLVPESASPRELARVVLDIIRAANLQALSENEMERAESCPSAAAPVGAGLVAGPIASDVGSPGSAPFLKSKPRKAPAKKSAKQTTRKAKRNG